MFVRVYMTVRVSVIENGNQSNISRLTTFDKLKCIIYVVELLLAVVHAATDVLLLFVYCFSRRYSKRLRRKMDVEKKYDDIFSSVVEQALSNESLRMSPPPAPLFEKKVH